MQKCTLILIINHIQMILIFFCKLVILHIIIIAKYEKGGKNKEATRMSPAEKKQTIIKY